LVASISINALKLSKEREVRKKKENGKILFYSLNGMEKEGTTYLFSLTRIGRKKNVGRSRGEEGRSNSLLLKSIHQAAKKKNHKKRGEKKKKKKERGVEVDLLKV